MASRKRSVEVRLIRCHFHPTKFTVYNITYLLKFMHGRINPAFELSSFYVFYVCVLLTLFKYIRHSGK